MSFSEQDKINILLNIDIRVLTFSLFISCITFFLFPRIPLPFPSLVSILYFLVQFPGYSMFLGL